MESKQKIIDADSETKEQSCSPSTTIKIFADEQVSEKQLQELPFRNKKPTNPNILTDASNKIGDQQKQKKNRNLQNNRRKNKNKNKHIWRTTNANANIDTNTNININTDGNANIHTDITNDKNRGEFHGNEKWNGCNYHWYHFYRDHYHQRSINHGCLPHEDGIGMTMMATQNNSAGFQMPLTEFIPGNRHAMSFYHPQQQQKHHLHADDDNAKVPLEQQNNGGLFKNSVYANGNNACNNCVEPSSLDNNPQTCPWMDMINNNTHVGGVVVIHEGQSKIVSIPSDVGACLVKELLVQRDNYKTTAKYDHDLTKNGIIRPVQGRPVQRNTGVNNIDQEISSFPPASHQTSPFVQNGSPLPFKPSSGYPHSHSLQSQCPDNYFDHHPHHGSHAPGLNLHQPHNGYDSNSLPTHNFGMHMAPSTSYHPMIHPMIHHHQYPSTHSSIHPGMQQFNSPHEPLGWTVPGYGNLYDFNAGGKYTGNSSGEASTEKHYHKEEELIGKHHYRSDNKSREATPNRIDMNRGDPAKGNNLPQNHIYDNDNAATPHRAAIGDNDEGDPRRVSFSPVNPLPITPANADGVV